MSGDASIFFKHQSAIVILCRVHQRTANSIHTLYNIFASLNFQKKN